MRILGKCIIIKPALWSWPCSLLNTLLKLKSKNMFPMLFMERNLKKLSLKEYIFLLNLLMLRNKLLLCFSWWSRVLDSRNYLHQIYHSFKFNNLWAILRQLSWVGNHVTQKFIWCSINAKLLTTTSFQANIIMNCLLSHLSQLTNLTGFLKTITNRVGNLLMAIWKMKILWHTQHNNLRRKMCNWY